MAMHRKNWRPHRKLLGMGADAFILSGADHHTELIDLFQRREIPFVFTSIWDAASVHPTIGYDNFELARGAVEYLVAHGHHQYSRNTRPASWKVIEPEKEKQALSAASEFPGAGGFLRN